VTGNGEDSPLALWLVTAQDRTLAGAAEPGSF